MGPQIYLDRMNDTTHGDVCVVRIALKGVHKRRHQIIDRYGFERAFFEILDGGFAVLKLSNRWRRIVGAKSDFWSYIVLDALGYDASIARKTALFFISKATKTPPHRENILG